MSGSTGGRRLDASREFDDKATFFVSPTPKVYERFVNKMRQKLAGDDAPKIGEVYVLPVPPQCEQDSRFCHVKFKCWKGKEKYQCVCKYKRHDSYLIGIRNKTASQWFSLASSDLDIGDSIGIGLNVSYVDLLAIAGYDLLEDVQVNQSTVIDAVFFFSQLSENSDLHGTKKKIARHCLVLIIMSAEAARSNSIRDAIVEEWAGSTKYSFERNKKSEIVGWKSSIIRAWMKMSTILLERHDRRHGDDSDVIKALNDRLTSHRISNKKGPLNRVEQLDEEMGIAKQEKKPEKPGSKHTKYRGESSSSSKGESSSSSKGKGWK